MHNQTTSFCTATSHTTHKWLQHSKYKHTLLAAHCCCSYTYRHTPLSPPIHSAQRICIHPVPQQHHYPIVWFIPTTILISITHATNHNACIFFLPYNRIHTISQHQSQSNPLTNNIQEPHNKSSYNQKQTKCNHSITTLITILPLTITLLSKIECQIILITTTPFILFRFWTCRCDLSLPTRITIPLRVPTWQNSHATHAPTSVIICYFHPTLLNFPLVPHPNPTSFHTYTLPFTTLNDIKQTISTLFFENGPIHITFIQDTISFNEFYFSTTLVQLMG